MKLTLSKLFEDLGVHKLINYLVVVGDGLTYDHLVKLKNKFKGDFDWVLSYIGDWHVLKKYQHILMTIYLDTGFQELVELFHRGILAQVVSKEQDLTRHTTF